MALADPSRFTTGAQRSIAPQTSHKPALGAFAERDGHVSHPSAAPMSPTDRKLYLRALSAICSRKSAPVGSSALGWVRELLVARRIGRDPGCEADLRCRSFRLPMLAQELYAARKILLLSLRESPAAEPYFDVQFGQG